MKIQADEGLRLLKQKLLHNFHKFSLGLSLHSTEKLFWKERSLQNSANITRILQQVGAPSLIICRNTTITFKAGYSARSTALLATDCCVRRRASMYTDLHSALRFLAFYDLLPHCRSGLSRGDPDKYWCSVWATVKADLEAPELVKSQSTREERGEESGPVERCNPRKWKMLPLKHFSLYFPLWRFVDRIATKLLVYMVREE